jgi:hypothetical protein
MNELRKIALLALIIAVCGQSAVEAMAGKKSAKEIAALRLKLAKAREEALAAELALAEAEEESGKEEAAPASSSPTGKAPATEEQVAEEEEDSSADELATDTPKDLDAALLTFAKELTKFEGKEKQLEEKIGACFERHHFGHRHGHPGGHGKWEGGHVGVGRYNLTLSELIAELKKEPDLAETKLLKRELIRWVWHVLRSENRLGEMEKALVTAAKAVLDKTPKGRGHHRIHDWGRRGMGPGRGAGRRMGPPLEGQEPGEKGMGRGPGRGGPGRGGPGHQGGHP